MDILQTPCDKRWRNKKKIAKYITNIYTGPNSELINRKEAFEYLKDISESGDEYFYGENNISIKAFQSLLLKFFSKNHSIYIANSYSENKKVNRTIAFNFISNIYGDDNITKKFFSVLLEKFFSKDHLCMEIDNILLNINNESQEDSQEDSEEEDF